MNKKPFYLSLASCSGLWFLWSIGGLSFNPWQWPETARWGFVGLCIAILFGFFMADKIGRDVERWEREEQGKKQ